jgi:hypothetical protein
MQTFLPYPDFQESARVLDYRRLGKQRVEAKQIFLALTEPTYGWKNHPAVKMWRGAEDALLSYGIAMCEEWRARGYNDTMLSWFIEKRLARPPSDRQLPIWLGDVNFHLSHQSNLLRKDGAFYRPVFPTVPDNLPYVWPVVQ